jgi:hypothetical protein
LIIILKYVFKDIFMSTIWKLEDLVNHVTKGGVSSSNDGKNWVPARPMSGSFLFEKTKAAWEVFRGRADAVVWPQGQ